MRIRAHQRGEEDDLTCRPALSSLSSLSSQTVPHNVLTHKAHAPRNPQFRTQRGAEAQGGGVAIDIVDVCFWVPG